MCGAKDISIAFITPVAGKFTVQHNFLIMGGMRQGGDQITADPMKASLLFIDANKKHYLHQAWIAKVYNMSVCVTSVNALNGDDTISGAAGTTPVGGDIFPIRLAQYVPDNEFLPEGEYNVSDFFVTHASIIHIAVARCMRKP